MAASGLSNSTSGSSEGARGHLLVVDDDVDVVASLSNAFVEAGFSVATATDGGNAAMKVRNSRFDAIITDLKLPSMNGLQVVAVAKATDNNREAPIFVVSGYIDAEAVRRSASMNVTELHTKPFELPFLVGKVAQAVSLYRPDKPAYDSRIINAFLAGAGEVLSAYLGKVPEICKPFIKKSGVARGFTGLVGFTGLGLVGSMSLSYDRKVLTALTRRMLPGLAGAVTEELLEDVAGEVCNQVVGKVKINLSKIGLKIAIGLPERLHGDPHTVVHRSLSPVLGVEMRLDAGYCSVEFAMVAGAPLQREMAGDMVVEDVLIFE